MLEILKVYNLKGPYGVNVVSQLLLFLYVKSRKKSYNMKWNPSSRSSLLNTTPSDNNLILDVKKARKHISSIVFDCISKKDIKKLSTLFMVRTMLLVLFQTVGGILNRVTRDYMGYLIEIHKITILQMLSYGYVACSLISRLTSYISYI